MLLAFVPEHRFASDDWHFDAVRSAHDSSAVEDSENLRIGRRMAKQAPACRNGKIAAWTTDPSKIDGVRGATVTR